MNKRIVPALFIALAGLISAPTSAQISLGNVKRQAANSLGNAIENKIEQEMDKAAQHVVDKYWDRVLGKYYSDMYQNENSSSSRSGSKAQYPFTMSSDVDLEDSYHFNQSLKIKIDTYKKNGKLDETVLINTFTNTNANYIGTQIEPEGQTKNKEDFFIINDFENEAMVMLTENEGEKMRVAFSFKLDEDALAKMVEENKMNEENAEKIETPTYKEIGFKDILGYKCKGYEMETDETITEVWVSEKEISGMEKAVSMLGAKNSKTQAAALPDDYPKGTLMESTMTVKGSKEKNVMQVIEINTNSNLSFNMADYPDAGDVEKGEE